MTRGMYNETFPGWLQDFAEVNGATVNLNPEVYSSTAIYTISYGSEEIVLEDRRGSEDEVATLLSNNLEEADELAQEAGYTLDRDRSSRGVLLTD